MPKGVRTRTTIEANRPNKRWRILSGQPNTSSPARSYETEEAARYAAVEDFLSFGETVGLDLWDEDHPQDPMNKGWAVVDTFGENTSTKEFLERRLGAQPPAPDAAPASAPRLSGDDLEVLNAVFGDAIAYRIPEGESEEEIDEVIALKYKALAERLGVTPDL